jgi:hypothetical protein
MNHTKTAKLPISITHKKTHIGTPKTRINSAIGTDIHNKLISQINYYLYNEPFAVSPTKGIY